MAPLTQWGSRSPTGTPTWGVPLRAPSGGSRGVPPLGPAGGPRIVSFRKTPRDPPGPPGGQKSAHFVGYLINLPFGTNMAPLFLGFLTPRDKHGTPPKGGLDTPPKHPPYGPPLSYRFLETRKAQKGRFWGSFGTPFGPPLDPFGTPPGPPLGGPPGGGARGGARGPPGRPGAPGAKIRVSRCPAGDPQNGQKTPFFGGSGDPPMVPPIEPYWARGSQPPLASPSTGAMLWDRPCRSLAACMSIP